MPQNNSQAAVAEEVEIGTEKPVYDFSRISWADEKRMRRKDAQLQAELVKPEADNDLIDTLTAEIQAYMVRAIVRLPREWMVADAPEALDWDDPETLDYLRGTHMLRLKIDMIRAKAELSKN